MKKRKIYFFECLMKRVCYVIGALDYTWLHGLPNRHSHPSVFPMLLRGNPLR